MEISWTTRSRSPRSTVFIHWNCDGMGLTRSLCCRTFVCFFSRQTFRDASDILGVQPPTLGVLHLLSTWKRVISVTMTMTMTHSEKSHIHRMKAWPYRQECRDHGLTKKESVLLVKLARWQGAQVQTVKRQNVVQRYLK